jgi:hypothetical protein
MPVALEHAGGGPVYFAWAGPDETTFGEQHIRYDEYILSLEIDLEEGKIPVATLEMINPGSAWWLASDRQRWAWIAFDTDDSDGVKPAFFGRILALPSSMFGETVTVNFYAKPLDYLARKQTAADALKVLPWYDKVFVDPLYLDDPDHVLEGYSGVWHFDPVTHAITLSDYINGEAGEEEFFGSEIIYDSLTLTLGDPPPRAVRVDATVTYTQTTQGSVDIGPNAFSSYTGAGLVSDWPKPGTSLGGGWSVKSSSVDDGGVSTAYVKETGFEFKNNDTSHHSGDAMTVTETMSKPVFDGDHAEFDFKSSGSWTAGDPETGRAAAVSYQESSTWVLKYDIKTTLELDYAAARARTEHLTFTLALDSQPMLTDTDGDDDIETLAFSGADVGQNLPGESTPPIGDLGRRSYFPTDRGLSSVANRVGVARAHLLSKARPAEMAFSPVSFSRALDVTCQHSVRLHDSRRLPGGEGAGKVVNVKITVDGESGQFLGLITLKGAIGNGGTVVVEAGTPSIADADVLDSGVQLFIGRKLALDGVECLYSLPVDGLNDDGLKFPLTYDQVVVRSETLESAGETQQDVLARINSLNGLPQVSSAQGLFGTALELWKLAQEAAKTAQAALGGANKWYELELKPVADLSFEYSFDITAGPLLVEKQVDLSGGV